VRAGRSPAPVRELLLWALVLGLGVSVSLAQAALALLAARWVWRLATGRARVEWPLVVPFGAWVVVSAVAAARGAGSPWGLLKVKELVLIALFYVLLEALEEAWEVERWGGRLLAVAGGVGALGVLQVGACAWLEPLGPVLGRYATKCQRAHAFFSIYMTLAGVLSLVLLAALPRLVGGRPRPRPWALAAWCSGAAGLLATFVRGAWVGFAAGAAVMLALLPRRRLVAVVAVGLMGCGVLLVPAVRQRAWSIADPSDPTARERWAMWASALRMARDHPWLGVGPGQVRHAYPAYAAPEYRQRVRGHLHNTPLQILAERGVLGLGAWLAIFVAFFARSAAVLRALPHGAERERLLVVGSLAAVVGFLVGGLSEYNFGDDEVVMVAYAVMAVPFVVGAAGVASPRRT
jgi:putative inorganic carbon (HCO3(-)) transporter